jgi:hypothetical protein
MPIRLLEPRTIAGYRYGEGTILDLQDDKEEEYLVDRAVAEWYSVDDGSTSLAKANNLADLPDKAVARGNLGLGALAIQDDAYFTVSGGVQRTVSNKLSESISIADFWDGINTDHTSAVQAALNYAASNKVALRIGKKAWNVTSPIVVSLDGNGPLSLIGDGIDVSIIQLNTGENGLTINLPGNNWYFGGALAQSNGLTIINMTFSTTNAQIGDGLYIKGYATAGRTRTPVIFDNVFFRGASTAAQFWLRSVVFEDVGNVIMNSCMVMMGSSSNVTSTGVYIFGTEAGTPTVFSFNDCYIQRGNTSIYVGDWVQGVYITNCTLLAPVIGVRWNPSTGNGGLHITKGHINSVQYGVYGTQLFNTTITDCLFYRFDSSATDYRSVLLDGSSGIMTITGNMFNGLKTGTEVGVYVLASAATTSPALYGSIIDDNIFNNFNSYGIVLGPGAHQVHVGDGNIYPECAVRVANQSNDCSIDPKIYTTSLIKTLTGGAETEQISIGIPNAYFRAKPGSVSVMSQSLTGVPIVGQYDYDNASSTGINVVVILRMMDGTNLPAGDVKLGVVAVENSGAGFI